MANEPIDPEVIFSAASEIADAGERERYLAEACAADPALRDRVERLLKAASRSDRLFPNDQLGVAPGPVGESEAEGGKVGRYKLLEQIGEGGFGVVYVAEQEEPVRRRVALKIIKLGMDTRQVIARFEAERQALAMMDHPHIAKVLDAGATETGRPYFVMELVRGIPITEFCDRNHLPIRQRVQLFIAVCQAVQHAHQKGVIHRDLKPSNILVTMADGRPHPMVIDFGVAKAMNHRLTEKTLYTRFAQMIGTPAYMSPEQAEMSRDDVDTRSDIYSLGILLYELLTGTTPFPEERLREAGFAEIQRIIREEEPERPSTLVSRMSERPRSLAAGEDDEPGNLTRLLRGDLDWIILKAIDKDRTRRYETANGLAADLQRHLADEPVTASPPSALYQLSKFTRRHRTAVVAGVAMTLTVILGSGLATWQAIRATKAERLAGERLAEAEAATAEARQQETEKAAVNSWIIEALLSSARPYNPTGLASPRGVQVTLADAMLSASSTLESRFADQPTTEAKLREIIGEALVGTGAVEEGIQNLRRAVELLRAHEGIESTNLLRLEFSLGWELAFHFSGNSRDEHERALGREGGRLMEKAYERSEAVLGSAHEETLHWAFVLGVHYRRLGEIRKAAGLVEPAYERFQTLLNGNTPVPFNLQRTALNSLYVLRKEQGRHVEAYQLVKKLAQLVLQRPPGGQGQGEDLFTTRACHDLAGFYWSFDRDFDRAEQAFQRALESARRTAGDGNPTPTILFDLARLLRERGRFQEAARYMRDCLGCLIRTRGTDHSLSRWTGREVAAIHARIGDWLAVVSEFQRQREEGVTDASSLAYEILARHLADITESLPELRETLWQWIADHPEFRPGYSTQMLLLVLPLPVSERARVLQIASKRLADTRASEWSEEQRSLLKGLMAYQEERFDEVPTLLRPVAHNLANRRLAALARFFVALALQRDGRTAEAKLALEEANDLLNRLLRGGILDLPHPQDDWTTLASALLARAEAEVTILGQVVSEPMTKASLEAARSAWKPVHDLLLAMDDAARLQDYAKAHQLYLQARAHPAFEWETALQDIRRLPERASLILAQSGAREDYVTFLTEIYREDTRLPTFDYLWAGTVSPWDLPPELRTRIRKSTIAHYEDLPMPKGNIVSDLWRQHTVGIALYRLGRFEDALKCLRVGMESSRQDCSMSSTAHAALAAWRLGRANEARAWRQVAEKGMTMRTAACEDKLDPEWWGLSLADLALKEARRLMDDELVAETSSQPRTAGPPGVKPDVP